LNASELKAVHEAAEHHPARVFRAPGRVNLVGEHTDYSGGFCMPAALHFETRIAASPRSDRRLTLRSVEFKETVEIDLDAPLPERRKHWNAYPLGVLWSLRQAGFDSPGAALTITGDVPQGAGLGLGAHQR
jgi:galactokinase